MNSSPPDVCDQVLALVAELPSATEIADEVLRDRLLHFEQARNALEAAQAMVMVEMGSRAEAADRAEESAAGQPMWSSQCRVEFVADEIAVLLTCTRMAATHRYATAWRAAENMALSKAWLAGAIDARKVEVVCEQLRHLEAPEAEHLSVAAVDYAERHTAPQVREWMRRRVIAADPEAAEARRRYAASDRRVVITSRDDGTAELWALLPSIHAKHVQQLLNAAAREVSDDPGDSQPRTMDQRRADVLVDLLLGRSARPNVSLQVVVPVETVLGQGAQPGSIPGWGPATAHEVRELCGSSATPTDCVEPDIWARRLLTDASTGALLDIAEKQYRPSKGLDRAVRARDVTCRFPGCRRSASSSASGTDLDHTIPWPKGPTTSSNLAVLCRHHHRLKHSPGWKAELEPDGTMTWRTPTGFSVTTEPWQYNDSDPPRAPTD